MSEPPIHRRAVLKGAASAAAFGGLALGGTEAVAQPSGPASRPRRRVRLGVNYVPSRNWWFSWADFQTPSIRRDLADIAGLGLDHIRIMLIWPEFQPNPHYVRGELLDRLERMLDLADEARLDVEVTVFNGAVSGLLFVPPWLISNSTGKTRNFFTDAAALDAERALLRALAERIGRHRRFLGFDLSNEVHWAGIPLGMDLTTAEGDAWHETLFETCEQAAPGKLHVSGIDHYPWVTDAYFSRDGLATSGTATAIHTWAGWTEVIQRFGPLSTPSLHYSEFFIEMIKAFHTNPDREVWVEETGVSTVWMDAEFIPEWTEKSVRAMASCGNLFGITWWCSHDLNPDLTGFNPLEYDLGLMTNDRRGKAIGGVLRRLAAEFDAHPPAVLPRPTALVLPEHTIPDIAFLEAFARVIDSGERPAVVKQSRSQDAGYLAGRGIERLVWPDEVS